MMITSPLIIPNWPAPLGVRAITTTRFGGFSTGYYKSLNLSNYVGDDPKLVLKNRLYLAKLAGYQLEPAWLRQVHGNSIVPAETVHGLVLADASWTSVKGQPCVVMTADCLPILLCDLAATVVAAIHVGWRGLSSRIIAAVITQMQKIAKPETIIAWLGPAIGPKHFVVGNEVYVAINSSSPSDKHNYFYQISHNKWLLNIYNLAKMQLSCLGINSVFGGEYCTFSEDTSFFSYRRSNITGRMASIIWLSL